MSDICRLHSHNLYIVQLIPTVHMIQGNHSDYTFNKELLEITQLLQKSKVCLLRGVLSFSNRPINPSVFDKCSYVLKLFHLREDIQSCLL